MSWQWLENPARPARWEVMIHVLIKALILFLLVNLAYAALDPLDALGRVSIYNVLVPGLERVATNYNIRNNSESLISATSDITALVAATRIGAPKAADEFRVIVLGDSATRASRIPHNSTVTSLLNAAKLTTPDGQRIVTYNLAYPHPSLLKDFLLLEEALSRHTHPDAVIWPITLNSALPERQLTHPLVQDNLSTLYDWLASATGGSVPIITNTPNLTWENTLISQSRALADLLRLQMYGFTWAATRHDGGGVPRHTIQDEVVNPNTVPQTGLNQPAEFFAFEVIDAARALLGDIPMLIINEPIYQALPTDGLILNRYYRRDVYEHYQRVIQQYADENGWHYFDLWDAIPPEHFTNSPLHYDAEGARILAERLADIITQVLAEEAQ